MRVLPWLLGGLLAGLSACQSYDGHFVIPRQPASCSSVNASLADTAPAPQPDCLAYSVGQLRQAFHYTAYVKDNLQEYQLRMATLNAEGQLNDYNLSFYCPTSTYYGTPPVYCSSSPGMQLAVLHVGTDNTLFEMDVILSPAEYPAVEALAENQPPFGNARLVFPAGIPLPTSGYLQVCRLPVSSEGCAEVNLRALPDPLPSNVGEGSFSIAQYGLTLSSDWVMDDANQLLIIAAGPVRYYFNSAGFYLSQAGTCGAHTFKSYASEVYAYNSRFLDYVGTVNVTSHFGYSNFQPARVSLWVGVAFDASKIDPVILYTDEATGFYRGMDAFDVVPLPTLTYGASYWYPSTAATVPGLSVLEYAERMANLNDPCASQFNAWLYPNTTRNCTDGLVLSNGLCRDPSGRRLLHASAGRDAVAKAGVGVQRLKLTPSLAAALLTVLLIAGLLLLEHRRRAKPASPAGGPHSNPQAFDAL